jgi:hypothetical protein
MKLLIPQIFPNSLLPKHLLRQHLLEGCVLSGVNVFEHASVMMGCLPMYKSLLNFTFSVNQCRKSATPFPPLSCASKLYFSPSESQFDLISRHYLKSKEGEAFPIQDWTGP